MLLKENKWKFHPGRGLENDSYSYETKSRYRYHRQFLFGFLATIFGGIFYYYLFEPAVLHWLGLYQKFIVEWSLPISLLPAVGTGLSFPTATFVSVLMAQAIKRYFHVGKALSEIKGATHGIIMSLNFCSSDSARAKSFDEFRRVLRVLCCQACNEPYSVIVEVFESKAEFNTCFSPVLEGFRGALSNAGLEQLVVGSNGRYFHTLIQASTMVEQAAQVRMLQNLYYPSVVLLITVYVFFALFIALYAGNASTLIGTSFSAVVIGAGALLIMMARSKAIPFGRTKSEYRVRAFYKRLESEIDNADKTKVILSPSPRS